MIQHEHKAMNEFLNTTIRSSLQPGRVPMDYTHPRENDSFLTLSPAGFSALPRAFQQRTHRHRDLKLRTSTDATSGQVTARIVKIDVAHLHIFNPQGDYDARISLNLEAHLLHSPLHLKELTIEPTAEKPAPPERKKDRLSYKHLAYSVDLTRVDVQGLNAKYELEVEVNAPVLRGQMERGERGEESAFGEVVSGFLDDVVFLMRQRPMAAAAVV